MPAPAAHAHSPAGSKIKPAQRAACCQKRVVTQTWLAWPGQRLAPTPSLPCVRAPCSAPQSDPAQRPTARELYSWLKECPPNDDASSLRAYSPSASTGSPAVSFLPTPPAFNSAKTNLSSEPGGSAVIGGGGSGSRDGSGPVTPAPSGKGSGGGVLSLVRGHHHGGFFDSMRSWGSGRLSVRSWGSGASSAAPGGEQHKPHSLSPPATTEGWAGERVLRRPSSGAAAAASFKPPATPKDLPADPLSGQPGLFNPALSRILSRVMQQHQQAATGEQPPAAPDDNVLAV